MIPHTKIAFYIYSVNVSKTSMLYQCIDLEDGPYPNQRISFETFLEFKIIISHLPPQDQN